MSEILVEINKEDQNVLENALNLAQEAIKYDNNNDENEALKIYKKVVKMLKNQKIESSNTEKKILFKSILDSYEERIKIIEISLSKKQFLNEDFEIFQKTTFLSEEKPNLLSKTNKNKFTGNNDILNQVNLNYNVILDEKNGKFIEDSLNIINEEEKTNFLLEIIEKIAKFGGNFSKNLFVPNFIFQIVVDFVDEEKKINFLSQFIVFYEKIFVGEISNQKFKKNLNDFRIEIVKLYKEIPLKKMIVEENNGNTLLQYKNILKNNFYKIYKNNKNIDYPKIVMKIIKICQEILIKYEEIIDNGQDFVYFKNKKCILLLIKDVIIKILVNDIEIRMNHYFLYAKKKIVNN